MKTKTLHENKWISLKEIQHDNGIYTYAHETRCHGHIVSILPFRSDTFKSYLLRHELTPCWGEGEHLNSITGGVEIELGPKETAKLELWEEAGYEVELGDLIELGTCRASKSNDALYHLYAVDLTNKSKTGKAEGDGHSKLEAKEYCLFYPGIPWGKVQDPLIAITYQRLIKYQEEN